jgi:hypothetical protein
MAPSSVQLLKCEHLMIFSKKTLLIISKLQNNKRRSYANMNNLALIIN